MALLSRKEFAAMCHTSAAVINTNVSRGNVVLFEKKVDTENAKNEKFLTTYQKRFEEKLKKSNSSEKTTDEINSLYQKVVEKATKTVEKKTKEKKRKEINEKSKTEEDWDLRKKKAETIYKERMAEKEQMQLEKLAGKLLPSDLVFNIMRIHNTTIFSVFQNDCENLASIWCDILADGDREKLSEISEQISIKIGDIIKRAEDVALQAIDNAIEDYSETRNRGERK